MLKAVIKLFNGNSASWKELELFVGAFNTKGMAELGGRVYASNPTFPCSNIDDRKIKQK